MKSLTNMTLGKKIALLTTLGLVLAAAVFSFLSIQAVNQATDAMLEDRLTTASVVADYVDEALGRAVTELQNTARLIETNGANGLEGKIGTLQDTYRRLAIYVRGIYLLDGQGQIVWSQPATPAALKGEGLSLYPGFSQTIEGEQPGISGLVRAPMIDTPVVLLTSPTGDGQGKKGVLIIAIDPAQSNISGLIKSIRLGKTGYVEIVDQNGVVVVRTDPGPTPTPFEKSDHSGRFAALINAGEPTRGLCHTCHEPVQKVEARDVLAFVPLSDAKWGVAIRQSEAEALAPVNKLRQNLLLFGAGLIAVALLLVATATRDIVARIRILTTASQKIAGGDLSNPIVSNRQDEIGVLARSFEDMRLKLKTSRDELEQKTQELTATANENARLHRKVQREDRLRGELLRETLSIQEEERKRIARELHDETSQVLASLNANLEAASGMLPANGDNARARLKQAQALSISVLDDVHRLIYELRPTLLDDLGLVAAVRWLADNNLRSIGVKVSFKTVGQVRRLAPQVEVTLFRVIQEAVNNIARHANASKADISLHFRKHNIKVGISDDGTGFDVEGAIRSKIRPRGLGLLGMKERIELAKGTLKIKSRQAGGTEITIEIPINEEVANGQDKNTDSG